MNSHLIITYIIKQLSIAGTIKITDILSFSLISEDVVLLPSIQMEIKTSCTNLPPHHLSISWNIKHIKQYKTIVSEIVNIFYPSGLLLLYVINFIAYHSVAFLRKVFSQRFIKINPKESYFCDGYECKYIVFRNADR